MGSERVVVRRPGLSPAVTACVTLASDFVSLSHCSLLRRDSCWDRMRSSEFTVKWPASRLLSLWCVCVWLLGPEDVVSLSSQDQRERVWHDRLLGAW